MITLESIVRRSDEQLLASSMADETVMMNVETGDYLGLNAVGTAIWNALESFIVVKNICEQLEAEFEVDAATCEQETLRFLAKLQEEKLLEFQA